MESSFGIFVNKLRNTLSSTAYVTASTINAALPGNLVTREYDIQEHRCSAGPGLVWKVYSALKKSTQEEASVFVFEKKCLDNYPKRDRDLILDYIKKGVSQLTRLRHPSILIVQYPLEESRECLAFATEPVSASLANFLGAHDNLPSPIPEDISAAELYEIEIKYGLLSLSEGISFIHNDAKILHRNISPECIVISKRGSWKLFGFDFSASPINPNDFPLKFPHMNITNQTSDYPLIALPNLDYLAPEYISLASDPEPAVMLASDMYSLGALTYALYNRGKCLFPTGGSLNSFSSGRVSRIDNVRDSDLKCIPEDSRHHVKNLLSVDPTLRPDAHRFNQISIFEDVLIRTLQYLDSLFQWDNLEKSKFYKGLPEIMARMPLRVKINRVIPCLTREIVIPEMVPFVLPNLLFVAEEMEEKQFQQHLANALKPVFAMGHPIQVPLLLLQRMDLIISKSKNLVPDLIKTDILNMICRCLDSTASSTESATLVIQLQDLTLKTIPSLTPFMEALSIKKQLLPKIKKLCLSTGTLLVRVNCLVCIGKILDQMDKWTVLDEIIPFLGEIKSKEPAVIMASVGIIQVTLNNPKLGLTKEVMANKIIPFLMPLSIENGLNVQQFNAIMSLIREIVAKVETEHRSKVEQLCQMREQQSMAVMSYNKPSGANADVNGFTKFTFGGKDEGVDVSPETEKPTIKAIEPGPKREPKTRRSGPMKLGAKPVDLTSSLIDSNLTNLSSNKQTDLLTSPPASRALAGSAATTNRYPLLLSHPPQPPPAIPNSSLSKPNQPLTSSSTFDSLSLQNLNIKTSNQPKVPMGQMTRSTSSGAGTILAPTSSMTSRLSPTQQVPQLSKSDLEEFLK